MLPGRRRRFRLPRRRPLWLLGVVALAILGLVTLFRPAADDDEPPASSTSASPTRFMLATPTALVATPTAGSPLAVLAPDRSRTQPAQVLDVIDGDTIDVRIDGREERVRYYGVDTPERGDDCYREARERNGTLAGDTVLLLPDARDRDRFGRLLRYAFTEDGRSVEAQLIAEGLGYAWREDGAYRNQLVALEAETESRGVGCLW